MTLSAPEAPSEALPQLPAAGHSPPRAVLLEGVPGGMGGDGVKLIIHGPPRTKKNSLRRLKRGSRVYTVGSEAHEIWERDAIRQLRAYRVKEYERFDEPVHVRALIYREKDIGDLCGFLQAIGDVLEVGKPKRPKGGIIVNDRLIQSWDGSRLLKDATNPRVEIDIEPMVNANVC